MDLSVLSPFPKNLREILLLFYGFGGLHALRVLKRRGVRRLLKWIKGTLEDLELRERIEEEFQQKKEMILNELGKDDDSEGEAGSGDGGRGDGQSEEKEEQSSSEKGRISTDQTVH